MKKLLSLLLLALLSGPALAQNPTCPTRPSGDSTNACASTAFVAAAVGGGAITLANGSILIGNASNVATAQAMSQDCTITNAGVITCLKTNNVDFTALATAAATSAGLRGAISDETGTGALVFATTPTLVTPVLGAATATTINAIDVSTAANWFGAIKQAATTSATGVTELATSTEYRANTAGNISLTPAEVWTAAGEVTITYGTTTTIDFSTLINGVVTLTGNITTQTLSNVKAGQAGLVRFIQDGTGSRTTVWNTVLKFAGGTLPTLTTTANAVDVLSYQCSTTTFCTASLLKNVKNP